MQQVGLGHKNALFIALKECKWPAIPEYPNHAKHDIGSRESVNLLIYSFLRLYWLGIFLAGLGEYAYLEIELRGSDFNELLAQITFYASKERLDTFTGK